MSPGEIHSGGDHIGDHRRIDRHLQCLARFSLLRHLVSVDDGSRCGRCPGCTDQNGGYRTSIGAPLIHTEKQADGGHGMHCKRERNEEGHAHGRGLPREGPDHDPNADADEHGQEVGRGEKVRQTVGDELKKIKEAK